MKDEFTSLEIKCIPSRHRLAPFIYAAPPRLHQGQIWVPVPTPGAGPKIQKSSKRMKPFLKSIKDPNLFFLFPSLLDVTERQDQKWLRLVSSQPWMTLKSYPPIRGALWRNPHITFFTMLKGGSAGNFLLLYGKKKWKI